ncbi:hypothetical protein PIB30_020328 [Stylosanthes scabra]|uniref:Uncharacterized protein n=1 Tax=Stylosanthes scabra TaxID=79078 RepID=A0ABU6X834_9FABA|nr:hypothetical protein [Stylosanthes scabra]
MKNIRLRQRIERPESDDHKGHRVHREIAIVSGGIPEEGNPHLKSDQKKSELVPGRQITINTMIRRVFVDQGISADILFRRCFDAPGLTKKDLKAHSDNLVRCSGKRLT